MNAPANKAPPTGFTPGLHFMPGANGGVVITKTDHYSAALARQERVQQEVDGKALEDHENPGCWLLLSLVCDCMVLRQQALFQLTDTSALKYQVDGRACAEIQLTNGWRDRVVLSARTSTLVARNGGLQISAADRRRAARLYRSWFPELPPGDPWKYLLSDAAAWWYVRTPRNDFDHVMRFRPLQPLTREALARRASQMPQHPREDARRSIEHELFPEPETGPPVQEDEAHLSMVLEVIRGAAGDKGSDAASRDACLKAIDVELAGVKGADAFHVLMGLRSILLEGGLKGSALAPRTLVNYIPPVLMRLYRQLAWMRAVYRPAEEMHAMYEELIANTAASSRAPAGAFLGAFHRYLVILGAEPLLKPLSAGGPLRPPRARVLWPHEQALALEYIAACAPDEQVCTQASMMLILGCKVPLRPADYWNIRHGHVVGTSQLTIHFFTVVGDGGPKTAYTRRPVDIDDPDVARAVLAMRDLRTRQGSRDDERLLGHRDSPNGQYARRATEALLRAAMAWATGDIAAGAYDLRHTAITQLEDNLADRAWEARGGTDQVLNLVLLAYAGQAERRSAEQYIHRYEQRVARTSADARPAAWVDSEESAAALTTFEAVEHGLCTAREPMPKSPFRPLARSAAELTAKQRWQVLKHALTEASFSEVAALAFVEKRAVAEQMKDLAQAAKEAGLLNGMVGEGEHDLNIAIASMRTWAAEAKAAKWDGVRAALDDLQTKNEWLTLANLLRDWQTCVQGASLAMTNPTSFSRVVCFLSGHGAVSHTQMALLVTPLGQPGAQRLHHLGLAQLHSVERKGRPKVRLVVSPPGTAAAHAPDRVLSMLGLHWCLLMAGSALESQRSL